MNGGGKVVVPHLMRLSIKHSESEEYSRTLTIHHPYI
jgi:hypothetical protein